eukprot:evm.model.scf_253EXC.11 EVM.evm.TU.scf_253EXC.11   scf_253EXC:91147-98674(+)
MAIGQTRRPWRLAGCPRGSPSVARGAVLGAAVCAVVVTMAAVASGGEPGFSEEGSAQQLQTMDLRKLQQIAAGLIAKLLPTAAIVHEKWTGAVEDGYDIALLRLEKKSKFAKFAIGLPGRCEATGTALFVTLGWGGTENDTTSDALQVAERFKFLTGEDCAAEDLWGSTYQDSMLCAVGGKPGVETCPDRPPVTSPPPTSTSDGMLKFPDAEICKFRDDECSAAVVENIQDVKLLEPLAATRCAETTSQERCDSNDFCSWDRIASSCVGDVELALKDCLIPEWLTVKRFASCDTKASEEKCTILPGCLWNNEACESDLTSGVATEALQNSPEVAAALNEQTTCNTTGLDACLDDSKCLLIGGECRSSAFWKISGWFDPEADSALCLFYGAVYKCSDAVLPDCPSGCIVDEDVCDITLEAIAETAFDAEFAAVMKTALQECPLQESESDCSSFRL